MIVLVCDTKVNECGQKTEHFEIGHLLFWFNIKNLSTLLESACQITPRIRFLKEYLLVPFIFKEKKLKINKKPHHIEISY